MPSPSHLKSVYFRLTKRLGLNALARKCTAAGFRIITYHGVDADQDPVVNYDRLQVEPRVFRRQLEVVSRHFVVRPLDELLACFAGERASVPNALAITFDDGYRNNLDVAAGLLTEFGFHATFFVTADYVRGREYPWWYALREAVARAPVGELTGPGGGRWSLRTRADRVAAARAYEEALVQVPESERRPMVERILQRCGAGSEAPRYPMMCEHEVRELAELGFAVAPHSVRHLSFRYESRATCEEELRESHRYIQVLTGQAAKCFAFPYGHLPRSVSEFEPVLVGAGLAAAVTTVPGVNSPRTGPWELHRYDVNGSRDTANLEGYLSGVSGRTRRAHRVHYG